MILRFRVRAPAPVGSSAPAERIVEVEAARGEIRIGRVPGADIELPFPAVSQLHARIVVDASGRCVLVDEGSANGTFLGARRLAQGAPHPLAAGDLIRLADAVVRFEGEVPGGKAATAAGRAESTATLARRLVSDLFAACRPREAPRVRVADGPGAGRVLALDHPGRNYRVGRGPECDLVLDDQEVSREHASFERGWDGLLVRDLGSKNGVVVAGARIVGARRLDDGDAVILGCTRLEVEDPEDRYLRRMREYAQPASAAEARPEVAMDPGTAAVAPSPAAPAVPHASGSAAPNAPVPAARIPLLAAATAIAVLAAAAGLVVWLAFGG